MSQPVKEPRADLEFIQQTSDAMQVAEEQSRAETEETMDDRYLVSDLRILGNDISRVQEDVGYSVSLMEGKGQVINLALL